MTSLEGGREAVARAGSLIYLRRVSDDQLADFGIVSETVTQEGRELYRAFWAGADGYGGVVLFDRVMFESPHARGKVAVR